MKVYRIQTGVSEFHLRKNKISDEGAIKLLQILPETSVQEFSLAKNSLSREFKDAQYQIERVNKDGVKIKQSF